ncbi:unnamed protein product [Oppiella nova]|uniref:C2H2-type domain-containing protein n=1 Tax=Oppiella nova TaxID=334625 RepID=A0A7R9QBY5_9ACAR|nr:unnamed protein product [Oppiella nova]CAG2162817.1 unnamed protein product [Oppiella nova]
MSSLNSLYRLGYNRCRYIGCADKMILDMPGIDNMRERLLRVKCQSVIAIVDPFVMSSKDNWKRHFRTEVIDNKNVHFCLSNGCDFKTTIQKDMQFHVRKHQKKCFPFVCKAFNCDKAFKTRAALEEHETNHRCGFGIDGMEDIGICGLNALKVHYQMIVDNNKFKYCCKWGDCHYVITRLDCIEKHVHQHVCTFKTP